MFMTNCGFILIWYFGFEVVNLLHYKRVYIKEDIYQTEFIKVFLNNQTSKGGEHSFQVQLEIWKSIQQYLCYWSPKAQKDQAR